MYPEGHDILHSLYLESMIWRSYPDLEVMPESAMLTKSRINCPYHALLGYKAGSVAGGNDFFKYALMFISLFYALLNPETVRKSRFTARDQELPCAASDPGDGKCGTTAGSVTGQFHKIAFQILSGQTAFF